MVPSVRPVWAACGLIFLSYPVGCRETPDCFGPLEWDPRRQCLGLQDPGISVCMSKPSPSDDGVNFFCGFAPNHLPYVFAGSAGAVPESSDWAIVGADGKSYGAPMSDAERAICQTAAARWSAGFVPCSEVTDAGVRKDAAVQ